MTTLQDRIRDAASTALVAYAKGEPRLAATLLRNAAEMIDAEADAYDAYRFDADGLADHQCARSEP